MGREPSPMCPASCFRTSPPVGQLKHRGGTPRSPMSYLVSYLYLYSRPSDHLRRTSNLADLNILSDRLLFRPGLFPSGYSPIGRLALLPGILSIPVGTCPGSSQQSRFLVSWLWNGRPQCAFPAFPLGPLSVHRSGNSIKVADFEGCHHNDCSSSVPSAEAL
ncbi:hypothetical protein BC826DRAFT_367593 [Russula brevipes]|nr:hypothetical protein BC826DRAFT_367593 [Russula brevipes]